MITKERLLQLIDYAIRSEESAAPIYLRNYATALRWIDLESRQREAALESMQTLARDSDEHKKTLEQLRQDILKDKRDVF